ncbi:MAG: FG-GAP repeat protein [Planctomycetes bacterium]|nr:FG-GAP repeat protein [Planctomycetota bacterium]
MRSSRALVTPWLFLAPFAAGPVHGQVLVRSLPGSAFPGTTEGMSVDGCGDVDHDDVDDVIVGVTTPGGGGVVLVLSSRTGLVLHKLSNTSVGGFGAKVAGLGEIDGDGRADFGIVASGLAPSLPSQVRIVSGGTGLDLMDLLSPAGGSDLAAVGDVNSDAFSDVYVFAAGNTSLGPRAIHYGLSLATGRVIQDQGEVAGLGDLTGDGVSDYAIALASPVGRVLLYSGATGAFLRMIADPGAGGGLFAQSVAPAGDVNADHVADLLVGEPLYDGLATDCGRVFVLSGADGSVLCTIEGSIANEQLGDRGRLDGAGDVDGDGCADFVLGRPDAAGGAGSAEVWSGRTGQLLFAVTGDTPQDRFGLAVSGAGDANFDELGDIVVASLEGERVGIYRIDRAGVPYCFGDGAWTGCPCANFSLPGQEAGCQNSRNAGATLAAVGTPSVANDTVRFLGGHMPGGSTVVFFQATDTDGGTGELFGDGLLCLGGTFLRLGTRTIGNQGTVAFGADVPASPTIAYRGQVPATGGTRYYQARYRNSANFCSPATFNTTSALRLDWVP